jgi:hypothetical protein
VPDRTYIAERARVVAQFAALTLCSDNTRSIKSFLGREGLQTALTKFVIPFSAAKLFRDQLDLVRIG